MQNNPVLYHLSQVSQGETKGSIPQEWWLTQDKALLLTVGHQELKKTSLYLILEGKGKRWAPPVIPVDSSWCSRRCIGTIGLPINQAFPQQDLFYSIACKSDGWVQSTWEIDSALAFELEAIQLLRPRDEKRQIGGQHMSDITTSFRGTF